MSRGYVRQTWRFAESMEVEEKHTGRYGAPGQQRTQKRKSTTESIRRQNQWKKERDLRRLIKWNFRESDYWVTLTYKKGERHDLEKMMKDIRQMIQKVKRRYRKQEVEPKYIYRLAIGKKGGPHIHLLINRFSNQETATDLILQECWPHGHINLRMTREAGGFRDLAAYIAKPLEEWEPPDLKRFHPSRNLIRKEPKTEVIRRRYLVDRRGEIRYPKAPKGYYVDPDSVRMGINPVTGFVYRHYTVLRI